MLGKKEDKPPNLPEIIDEEEDGIRSKSKDVDGKKKKGEDASPEDKTRKTEGFLVPEFYRRQSVYRSHPLFRATLLIIVTAALIGGVGGYEWLLALKLKKTTMATQRLEVGESTRLQNQALLLKGTREKYKELEVLQKQIRIPLSPILDAIEKSIPKEISINDLAMSCIPVASSNTSRRRAAFRITVYFPDGTSPTNPGMTAWPDKIQKALDENTKGALKLTIPEWGAQEKIHIGKTKRDEEVKGWTRPLTFTIELDQDKK